MRPASLLTLLILLTGGIPALPQENNLKPGKNDVFLLMKDGTRLGTTVFLPKGEKAFPAVLVRTPYNRTAEEWMGKAFNLFKIAVIIQDVRGKFTSGGAFYPFMNERDDGLQTLHWIRHQPWSNGTIAGWGGSYVGFTQWAISDSLDFLTLLLTGANLYEFTYPDGLFSLQTAYIWGTQNASRELNVIQKEKEQSSLLTLPLSLADDSAIMNIPFFNDWIEHPEYDSYWEKLNFRGKTKAPVLSMAGWYDLFLKAQIADFQALDSKENPDCRMIIGPWCHGKQGEANEYGGTKKTGSPTAIFKYVKAILKEKESKLSSPLKNSKFNYFIMERNEYVGSDTWPPKETKITDYYLDPSGKLYSGTLPPNGSMQYIYSPADPYPSHGGTALGDGVGPARQNENLTRKDQLAFEMSIEEKPLVLLGPVSATLWLSSSAACTDFFVCLQDVFPDGKIINIQEGGSQVKFDGQAPQKAEISVWATGYQLNPGHKLRVVISSGWFPRYNRNLNTCEPAFTATTMKDAIQKLFLGTDHPSALHLPIYTLDTKK